ncbi:MAG: hypothetical protein VX764_02230 [Planctomycetota bacterium]|nr:hypothetical protein [Planctomycetota bacterium]
MTQFYKQSGFTLARANPSTRVLLTLFLLTVLAGCVVALLQYSGRSGGLSTDNAKQWVQGNEKDYEAEELYAEKSPREILSIVHDHIFAVALLLFVVLHLVELTPWTEGPKITLSIIGYGSLALSLLSPWWLYLQWAVAPFTLRIGGTGLLLVLASGSLACLDELWLARWRRRKAGKKEPAAPAPLFPEKRESAGGCPLGHSESSSEEP